MFAMFLTKGNKDILLPQKIIEGKSVKEEKLTTIKHSYLVSHLSHFRFKSKIMRQGSDT
jgi:hypothetical protein